MNFHEARWTNGKRELRGWWSYKWASDRFVIMLDRVDRDTGFEKTMTVSGDKPEWGRWKLVSDGESKS